MPPSPPFVSSPACPPSPKGSARPRPSYGEAPGTARRARIATLLALPIGVWAAPIVPAAHAQATGPDAPIFWDDGDADNQPEIDEGRLRGAPDGGGAPPPSVTPPSVTPPSVTPPSDPDAIAFEASQLDYDSDADTVTASGNVVLRRAGQEVIADAVTWNRNTGQIIATGNIRFTDADGNVLYTDSVELTEELRAGALENMLLALAGGGRLAARGGTRDDDGTIALVSATYSACAIETPEGCPKTPSWRIVADRVIYDPETQNIRFRGARLELFGASVLPLPGLAIVANNDPVSGIVSPDLRLSQSNGVEISSGYYWRLAPNRELTVGANVYTEVLPMVSARYRALTEDGAYQITGYATEGRRIPINGSLDGTGEGGADDSQRDFRGYLDTNGRFQLSPEWSVTGSVRVASDRTFLRRYDISRDDRLRSTFDVERIDDDSYLSIAGWATQTLRFGEEQGLVPIALPVIDYRQRVADPLLGGRIMLHANSLALVRTDGQDTQRAFAGATWSLRRLTGMGQEVVLTALTRGDVYHSDENALTSVALYRGDEGWQGRAVAIGAVDVKWPLVGELFGGRQVLTPRVQLVASPEIRNLAIPNEDSRAIDLEDSNLFALNRFPGYDRVEDGVRITYGFDWQFEMPGWRISSTVGQSYRLSDELVLLPDGTGLTTRTSDVVGRTRVRWRDFIEFTHRFRADKDNLTLRRNEIDVTLGSRETYVEVGYLKLNRDIALGLEDLRDREELRAAARVAFASYWSVFGSTVVNLTDRAEDPRLTSDGFEPLRTRLGVAYEDDCLEIGLTWRRDYRTTGDAERGNTFLATFSLKNLGFQ